MSDKRLVWLRERLAKTSSAPDCFAELVGVYNPEDHMVTMSLVITIDGTEYRTIRYRKQIIVKSGEDETEYLRQSHRNMIAFMIQTYGNAEWRVVIKKFLKWSSNPTHKAIMQKWV